MKQFVVGMLLCMLVVLGCKTKKKSTAPSTEYAKWEMLYNTSTIFKQYLKIYDSVLPKVIRVVKIDKITKDSTLTNTEGIDWSFWQHEMDKINLAQQQFDNLYRIKQFASVEQSILSTTVTASAKNLTAKKIIINTELSDNDLNMLFAEYTDNGIVKKLMFAPRKSLQLIEINGTHNKVTQLEFLF